MPYVGFACRSARTKLSATIGVAAAVVLVLSAQTAAALPCRSCGGGDDGGGGTPSLPLQASYLVGFNQFARVSCTRSSPDQQLCGVSSDTLPADDDIFLDEYHDAGAGRLVITLQDAEDVTWWKSVSAVDSTGRTMQSVSLQDHAHGPVTMNFDQASSLTALVFSKAGFLGAATRTYDLRGLSTKAGERLVFTWSADGCGDGRGGDGHGRSC